MIRFCSPRLSDPKPSPKADRWTLRADSSITVARSSSMRRSIRAISARGSSRGTSKRWTSSPQHGQPTLLLEVLDQPSQPLLGLGQSGGVVAAAADRILQLLTV